MVQSSGPPSTSVALEEIAMMPVEVPHPAEVLSYLSQHPKVEPLVAPICRAARSELPGDVQLSLELYQDRESDDSYLTLYGRQEQYAPDLLERIEAVSEDLGALLQGCTEWLLLTTDYRSPK